MSIPKRIQYIIIGVSVALGVAALFVGLYFAYFKTSDSTSTTTKSTPNEERESTILNSFVSTTKAPKVAVENGTESLTLTSKLNGSNIEVTSNHVPNYIPLIGGIVAPADRKTLLADLGFIDQNPNSIPTYSTTFTFPVTPVEANESEDTQLGIIGICLNGTRLFNPYANPLDADAISDEVFDMSYGHSSGTSESKGEGYHYHRFSSTESYLYKNISSDEVATELNKFEHSPLFGYLLDGYPVYGPNGYNKQGKIVILRSSYTGVSDSSGNPTYVAGSGDLDEHNGIMSLTPDFGNVYHYVANVSANSDGSAKVGIDFNYALDLRTLFKDYWVAPLFSTLDNDDTQYIAALQNGFTLKNTDSTKANITIQGIDSFTLLDTDQVVTFNHKGNSKSKYAQFLTAMYNAFNVDTTLRNKIQTVMTAFPHMPISYKGKVTQTETNPDPGPGNGPQTGGHH